MRVGKVWAFVGRRTKCTKKNITFLKSDTGVSVTSTRGKLEVLQKHCHHLGKISVDSDLMPIGKRKLRVVSSCGSMSESCEDDCLDIEIEKVEIVKCIRKLKKNKIGESDGLMDELLKYGGSGMVCLLEQSFSVVWHEETVPRQWLTVDLLKKSDREDPGNYRGISLY